MTRFRNIIAPAFLAGALIAPTISAQTVITTPGSYGWVDASTPDGSKPVGSTSASITTAQPFDGNGSLQLSMNGFAQPAFYTNDSHVLGSLSNVTSAGFNWMQATGSPGNPVFRLFLTDLNGTGSGGFGSMGWYGTDATGWQSSGNLAQSGNFFFRAGGSQLTDNCTARVPSFDPNRQTIANWISACNGGSSLYNLGSAVVTGIEIDQGRWPGFTGTNVSYADDVTIGYGRVATTFNFEASQSTVPEPSSMALLGTGLIGLVPMVRRRRKR